MLEPVRGDGGTDERVGRPSLATARYMVFSGKWREHHQPSLLEWYEDEGPTSSMEEAATSSLTLVMS